MALPLEVEPLDADPGTALVEARLHPEPGKRRGTHQRWPWFSGTILVVFVLAGLIGPWVVPYDPNAIDLANALKPPVLFGGTWSHPFGTDDIGRDMLSRTIDGARVALLVSIAVVFIAGIIGLLIAMVAGYRGGRLDAFLMRTTDASLAFPVILFAIVVVGVFGPSTALVVLILALAFWPSYARVLRSEVLQVNTMDYVTMARTMGASPKWVVRQHILPNIIPTLLVLLSLQLGLAIIAEGSLSFLGLGVPAPAASWGGMLNDGRKHLSDGWWMPIIPGIALSLTVLATNLMGDWLRVRSDPATRR